MERNILTETMERTFHMLHQIDMKVKKMGEVPFGVRKATYEEQKAMYDSLTPEKVAALIAKFGEKEVSAWLSKFEEVENA